MDGWGQCKEVMRPCLGFEVGLRAGGIATQAVRVTGRNVGDTGTGEEDGQASVHAATDDSILD